MACYSHSRISTFEQCRHKYKLHYIDKVKVEIPTTIEAFMGDVVHRTLQKLYSDLQYMKLDTLAELLDFFRQTWGKEYSENILIVKKNITAENYRAMGERYVTLYYERYKPFDQMTVLGIETGERLTLPDGNEYHVKIDRLACKGDTYYVCDYKTNMKMKSQSDADADRQLAMYSVWVRDKHKDAKKVILLWHMLAFDKEMTSERSEEQLNMLVQDVSGSIREIESCKEWPARVSGLCGYCVYRGMCPSFKHEFELEAKTVREFKADDGVKIVDELAETEGKLAELEGHKAELRVELIAFAAQKELNMVYGSNKKASVKPFAKIVYPENMERLIGLLKEKNVYDNVIALSYPKLNSLIKKGRADPEIVGQVRIETSHRITLSDKK